MADPASSRTGLPALLDVQARLVDRAGRGDYWRWLAHVQAAAGCTRPVRLAGQVHTVDTATGEITATRSTADMPDAVMYKACGNRRASVCPSCAETYRADAYQLVLAGLAGGKGVPDTVAGHPAVFATPTPPSFGLVHTKRQTKTGRPAPCHARRRAECCPHGRLLHCPAVHPDGDARLGQPLCGDCYDHDHQVVWNVHAGELWRRTTIALQRAVDKHRPAGGGRARVAFGKVAEYQRRGVVHFHAILRLDGIHPTDPTAVVAPPDWASVFVLAHAVRDAVGHTAFRTLPHPDNPAGWPIRWGDPDKGLDIRPIRYPGDRQIEQSAVAGYLAKYATKSTEATGHVSQRITTATVDLYADRSHTGRLIEACWRLGTPPRRQPGLSSGQWRDRLDLWRTSEFRRLRRHAHNLGYGGHFFTKSRRYSTTFAALRAVRRTWRRAQLADNAQQHDTETTVVFTALTYAGIGWHTTADALLANTSAALARERRRAAREARTAVA